MSEGALKRPIQPRPSQASPARVAIVVFPGANCDRDTRHVAGDVLGARVDMVWHAERALPPADLVILPGGFSYGDYLRPGAIARFAPVMRAVERFAAQGGAVLGICNGFQVLTEAGLLPGALRPNRGGRFVCRDALLEVDPRAHASGAPCLAALHPGERISLPVAHRDGNYTASPKTLARLQARGQILLRYVDDDGEVRPHAALNGSMGAVAAVANEAGNVVGMMPHPERAAEAILAGPRGRLIGHEAPPGRRLLAGLLGNLPPRPASAGASDPQRPRLRPRTPSAAPRPPQEARPNPSPAGPSASLAHAVRGDAPVAPAAVVAAHGLTPGEYQRAVAGLGRHPTWTELGILSALWSEHCSYKSSRVHLARLPSTGARVVEGPGENAGVVDVGGGWVAVFKMESHNHPSYLDPVQGAATGVGGILRDVFTMGARPIATLDSLRFGRPEHPKTPWLVDGVVRGVGGYGNAVGVATVGGEVGFDPSYDGNILVNVMSLGVARADRLQRGAAVGPGNPVVYVGSPTGRDGLHGATMASSTFAGDPAAAPGDREGAGDGVGRGARGGDAAKRPSVQVADPFTEKRLIEACLELFETDWCAGIQDMGAAGLTSSAFEMASRGGVGLALDLDAVPQRGGALTPYELLLSESQERMLLVVRRGREGDVLALFRRWGLEAAVIGQVTDTQRVQARAGGALVADVPVAVGVDDAPRYDRPRARPADLEARWAALDGALDEVPDPSPGEEARHRLLALLGAPNVCSRRAVFERYDSMVGASTVVRPGDGDAAVVRLPPETVEGGAEGDRVAERGLALAVDAAPRRTWLDPRRGAALGLAECCRNLATAGAEPAGVTDCLNFGDPTRPEVMWSFAEAVDGLAEAALALAAPIVGGNVSFYNETEAAEGGRRLAVKPTPTVSAVGAVEDVARAPGLGFARAGLEVALLGEPAAAPSEALAGSVYLADLYDLCVGRPPAVDWERERAVQGACRELVRGARVEAVHDVGEGGLAVALAEMCVGGARGARVGCLARLPWLDLASRGGPGAGGGRLDAALFGEEPGQILVAYEPAQGGAVRAEAARSGAPLHVLGRVGGDALRVEDAGGGLVLEAPVAALGERLDGGLRRALDAGRGHAPER